MAGGKPSRRAHNGINSKKRRKRRKKVLDRYGEVCFYCNKDTPDLTMDHFWPSKLCCDFNLPTWLREHITNKRPACHECNNKKADEMPGTMDEFWFWVNEQLELREATQ